MNPASFSKERQVAISAIETACKISMEIFGNATSIIKSDSSPVTMADYACQAAIISQLKQSFPKDRIVAEEDSNQTTPHFLHTVASLVNKFTYQQYSDSEITSLIDQGRDLGGPGRFWTIDPIDGTKGFLRGGQFAICVALIVDGQVELGVLGCPNLPHSINKTDRKGSILFAVRNQGAFQIIENFLTRIQTSIESESTRSVFCESVEALHSSQSTSSQIADLLGITRPPVRMDSQVKYGVIARGDADIYMRIPTNAKYQENIWDHAAGSLIVQEAGGVVCDIDGKKLDFGLGRTLSGNRGIIATNNKLIEKVILAARKVLSKI